MAFPFLETASKSVRTFFPFAKRAVLEGISANRAIEAFRLAGNAIRRTDALELIRQIRGVERIGSALKNLRLSNRPDPNRLPEALTKTRRRFGFTVKVTVYSPAEDTTFDRWITVATDKLLTREEIEDFASEMASDESYGRELEAQSSQLYSGYKAAI